MIQVGLCSGGIGLFNKLIDLPHPFFEPAFKTDIAIADMSTLRCDAKCHQVALTRQRHSLVQRCLKCIIICNNMICRKHGDHIVTVLCFNQLSCRGNSWRRAPGNWLKDNVRRRNAHLLELACHHEAVILVAQDQWRAGIAGIFQAQRRLLDQRCTADQRMKLLWVQ